MLTSQKLGGQKATFVERVLDVRQGELCWVVGTVYMEMAEKPNVLNDIEKDVRSPSRTHKRSFLIIDSIG